MCIRDSFRLVVRPILGPLSDRLSDRFAASRFAGYVTPFFTTRAETVVFAPPFHRPRAALRHLQISLTASLDLSYAKGLTALFRAQNLFAKG